MNVLLGCWETSEDDIYRCLFGLLFVSHYTGLYIIVLFGNGYYCDVIINILLIN